MLSSLDQNKSQNAIASAVLSYLQSIKRIGSKTAQGVTDLKEKVLKLYRNLDEVQCRKTA
jgi:Holliday junction DNA helicase RuvA